MAVGVGGAVVLHEEGDGAVAGDAGDCFGVKFEVGDHVGDGVSLQLVDAGGFLVVVFADGFFVPPADGAALGPALIGWERVGAGAEGVCGVEWAAKDCGEPLLGAGDVVGGDG